MLNPVVGTLAIDGDLVSEIVGRLINNWAEVENPSVQENRIDLSERLFCCFEQKSYFRFFGYIGLDEDCLSAFCFNFRYDSLALRFSTPRDNDRGSL